jgi:DNA-binding winged helix-turn-helix (wHTH) protein
MRPRPKTEDANASPSAHPSGPESSLEATAAILPFHRPPGPRDTVYRFEDFVLDRALFELRSGGERIPIAPKVFDLILVLAENHDRVVTHSDLRAALWPEVTVTDASITYTIREARRVLGDDGVSQRIIRSVRGRGYRFVARVG